MPEHAEPPRAEQPSPHRPRDAADVETLLGELTLAEKALLTSGSSFWWTAPVPRLDIPAIMVSDGPHGLRTQKDMGDHIGLGGAEPATCFPPAASIASSWNPDLLHRVGQALGREARATGVSVVLGPGVNMKRSPLCGRNFEYLSEDPYLAGELAVALVDGVQSQGVGTSVKHYAANNQEHERLRVDAQIDERTLREIYLPAFETVVRRSQPWTVMCSYNKVNGTSASANAWLLQTMLREEFGFQGLVVSDWGAVYHRVAAVLAGTDLEMPPNKRSPEQVVAAVESGEIPLDVLDARVRAVLDLVRKGAHVLDLDETIDIEADHALAREAAGESIVLLRNENDLLPLAPGTSVAVIGEFARTPRYQGAGSSQVTPTRLDSALETLAEVFEVTFAPGYRLAGSPVPEDADEAELRAEAVRAAAAADVAVVLVGLPGSYESEGFDRTHLDLPADQAELLAAVAAANPNVATVLVNGSTVQLGEVLAHSRAVVEAWLGGQAGAAAIADVLSGRVNPSGRLAETMPLRLEDNSSYLNFPGEGLVVRYGEGVFIGYRGYDAAHQEVAFPFGFGLSYTTFALSDLAVTTSGSAADGNLAALVEVTVTNTGSRAGAEVVQVYVHDRVSAIPRPERELKGFIKVALEPGESRRVSLTLDQRAFSFFSAPLGRWVVESGEFDIQVGSHSRDLPLNATVSIDAPSIASPLELDSTLDEWLQDPLAKELMAEEIASGQTDPTANAELAAMVGSMPMNAMAAFDGMSLDLDALERVLARRAERLT
ncbi:MAG: glycoside hydrolase family 3 C-terminal domain-containing protein [Actinomycetales bacterium]